jgi:DNA replication protein DnaC
MSGELPLNKESKFLCSGQVIPGGYVCCDNFYENGEQHGSGMHIILRPQKTAFGDICIQTSVLADKFNGHPVYCPDFTKANQDLFPVTPEQQKTFESYDRELYRKYNLDNGGIDEKIKKIQTFYGSIFKVLIIHGGSGTGKTYLSTALMNQERGRGRTVEFIKWIELCTKFREMENVGYINDCNILIVDDFGEDKDTEWVLGRFKNVLDTFRMQGRPEKLVITTNMTVDELITTYEEKLAGRIISGSLAIGIDGPNYNLKGAE